MLLYDVRVAGARAAHPVPVELNQRLPAAHSQRPGLHGELPAIRQEEIYQVTRPRRLGVSRDSETNRIFTELESC